MSVKSKQIEERYYNGSQSINYRLIYEALGKKIKIEIKRDSYDNQSSAVGYVWSLEQLEWKAVYSIPYNDIKSLKIFYQAKPAEVVGKFSEDVKIIQDKIHIILS